MKNRLLTGVLAFSATAALAQSPDPRATPRIDQRQVNQQNRINQGVASGALNSQEAARLQNQQNKIAADVAAAKADGKVTAAERRQITREQNHAGHNIARKKHNAH